MFEHESTGTIRINGCAGTNLKKIFLALFTVGSKAYIKQRARFGKMEFVVVKKVYRQTPRNTASEGIQPEVMYLDTYNRMWAENELLLQENALDLATLYWQNLYQEGRSLFEQSKCLPIPPEGCN